MGATRATQTLAEGTLHRERKMWQSNRKMMKPWTIDRRWGWSTPLQSLKSCRCAGTVAENRIRIPPTTEHSLLKPIAMHKRWQKVSLLWPLPTRRLRLPKRLRSESNTANRVKQTSTDANPDRSICTNMHQTTSKTIANRKTQLNTWFYFLIKGGIFFERGG